eukprot:11464774-Alexandrium_andersonii.AAC.1
MLPDDEVGWRCPVPDCGAQLPRWGQKRLRAARQRHEAERHPNIGKTELIKLAMVRGQQARREMLDAKRERAVEAYNAGC